MICDDCKKEKEDVKDTTCPYSEDIYDEMIGVKLCDDCYHERAMDI